MKRRLTNLKLIHEKRMPEFNNQKINNGIFQRDSLFLSFFSPNTSP